MRSGFSLVELSIVLVILGLLTGGILAGQSLIRAAELRAVSTEYGRYATAVSSFRDKYFGLPGDITNATKFWGQAPSCPGAYNEGTNTITCDGNGDGRVYFTGPNTSPTANEALRFWQQLGNAGLIEGQYNGVTSSTTGYWLGVDANNTPASKLSNARWSLALSNNTTGTANSAFFWIDFGPLSFVLGGITAGTWNSARVLKPEEAWNIDTKMDDGKPGMGRAMTNWNNNCTEASVGTDMQTNYNLDDSSTACVFIIRVN